MQPTDFIVIGAVSVVCIIYLFRKPDEAPRMIDDEQVLAVPDLLASQCLTCNAIRTQTGSWLSPKQVPLPQGCRVSHGYCPHCEKKAYAELTSVLSKNK